MISSRSGRGSALSKWTRDGLLTSGDTYGRWRTSRLVTSPAAPPSTRSVVSGDAHVRACVLRREARDYVQCDAPRFCGIPSKWNIERQPMARERRRISIRSMSAEDVALASIGSRECDESLHLARGPNFEFHARSIGRYLRDGRSRSGEIREHSPTRCRYRLDPRSFIDAKCVGTCPRSLAVPS